MVEKVAGSPGPLVRLYLAAQDSELAVLNAVMMRAGLLWECPKCGWYSTVEESPCGNCNTERPKGDEP